jgi:hypothetical protein
MTMMSKQTAKPNIKQFVLKIQGNNFDSKQEPFGFRLGFRGLSKAKRRLPSYSTSAPWQPIGAAIPKNIARATPPAGRRRTYSYRTMNNPGQSSAPGSKVMKRLTKIVKETEHPAG